MFALTEADDGRRGRRGRSSTRLRVVPQCSHVESDPTGRGIITVTSPGGEVTTYRFLDVLFTLTEPLGENLAQYLAIIKVSTGIDAMVGRPPQGPRIDEIGAISSVANTPILALYINTKTPGITPEELMTQLKLKTPDQLMAEDPEAFQAALDNARKTLEPILATLRPPR